MLEPVVNKLSAVAWYSRTRQGPVLKPTRLGFRVRALAEVVVAAASLDVAALARLRPGAMVPLAGLDAGRATVRVGGRTLLQLRVNPDVAGDGAVTAADPGLGEPHGGVEASEADDLAPLRSGQERVLEQLAALGNRLEDLGARQTELADQLLLGGPGGEADSAHRRPFAYIAQDDLDPLAQLVAPERLAVIALILSFLPADLAGSSLARLPAQRQVGVAARIATLERTSTEVVTVIEDHLRGHLAALGAWSAATGTRGIEVLTAILGLTPRSVERHVMEGLQARVPELAEDLFVFEDVVLLDGPTLAAIAARVGDSGSGSGSSGCARGDSSLRSCRAEGRACYAASTGAPWPQSAQ